MVDAGTIVDARYRIVSRIGSGGMADVYQAEDLQLGRQIALKLLHRRFAEDQEFVERFRREASSAAGLAHQNVVSVFDRGEWDGTYYIAMEHLTGRSLKAIVTESGPLDPATAIDLAIQILRAARFAHRHGVIHRDLKPQNVIVDDEGRVKVTDFGIAKAGASDMTQTGSIMGTAQYLSPEQAQGHGVSEASDLYAVGIVLYELLTGVIPFDGDTAVTIALKQVSQAPNPPSALNPAVTPELDAVVLCALAKEPLERFADAEQFIVALEHARTTLDGQGGATAAFAAAPAVEAPLVHDPAPDATPVLAGAPAAGAIPPAAPSPRRRRRLRWWWIAALALALAATGATALVLATHKQRITVPDVRGRTEPAAVSTLQSAGLRPQSLHVIDGAPVGRVISQQPRGASAVNRGSTVVLTVSDGPGSAAVPDVTGLERHAAARVLRRAGFTVRSALVPSDTVPVGHVVATSPAASTAAAAGSPLTLEISSGPQLVSVPAAVGKSQDEATTVLSAAGLQVTSTEQPSQSQAPGTVLAQAPAAGAMARKGSAVKLTVAQAPSVVGAPNVVSAPNVVGASESDASAQLGAAGLAPRIVTQPVTKTAQDGVVLKQRPKAGQRVKRGGRVTIYVGKLAQTPPPTTTPTTPTAPAPGPATTIPHAL